MDVITLVIYAVLACVVIVPILLVLGFILMMFFPSIKNTWLSSQLKNTGISAPAIVLSSKEQGAKMTNDSVDGYWVTFELQVNPADSPSFKTTIKSLVPDPDPEYISPGQKIWVRFDPKDTSRVIFEYFDSQKMMLLEEPEWKSKRDAYLALDKRYTQLRETGEQASAIILEKEKVIDIQTSHGLGSLYRLKFNITPKSGASFQAESQAILIENKKYSVGKTVNVRLDPFDRSMVVLEGSPDSLLSNAKSLFTISL